MTGTDAAARSATDGAATIAAGRASAGIELGSTRIKVCLVGEHPADVLATGAFEWENALVDGRWTYALDDVRAGLAAAWADLVAESERRHGVGPTRLRALGVSAMMHGYLAFDGAGELLVPFRTWRNTSTGAASAELSTRFGVNIPLRWSIAHLHQAVLDHESHVPRIGHLTTLAGHVHELLTGHRVLGVGDASGVFPIDPKTGGFDEALARSYDELVAGGDLPHPLLDLLPEVLPAGADAGALTSDGARLLDPSGALEAGAILAPPEGDAGTGMVATNAVLPRTGNVSAGTSVFAMVVLERPLQHPHEELDVVTTPAGDPVAMVHCNNGASELGAWAGLFRRFAEAAGTPIPADRVFEVLLTEALEGAADAGGLLAYNHLAGEPVAGLTEGRPVFVRTPDSAFTLANAMRAQVYGVFGTLALGMAVLESEGVRLERMYAHGGLFRTAGVAQRLLAAALDTPVAVAEGAGEGGAWGMALLAAYAAERADGASASDLAGWLADRVFAGARTDPVEPDPADVAGFADYLARYRAGLAIERAAVDAT